MIKRIFALLILVILSVSALFSCGNVEDASTTNPPLIENPDNTTKDEKFEISEKTYPYGEDDSLVLDVRNITDKNCTVKVTVDFVRENGMTRTITKSFEGLPAGYNQSFFFYPGTAFKRYTYTVEYEEYEGECLIQYVEISTDSKFEAGRTPIGRNEDGSNIWGESIEVHLYEKNTYGASLYTNSTVLIIDKNGNLFQFYTPSGGNLINKKADGTYSSIYSVKDPKTGKVITAPKGELVWPEEIKDGAKVIVIVNRVEKEPFSK